jgi:hypothetical protein
MFLPATLANLMLHVFKLRAMFLTQHLTVAVKKLGFMNAILLN